jgi:Cu+-exporting ATPase
MIRRQFIKLATFTGAGGLASLSSLEALESDHVERAITTSEVKSITWRVHGFTCVTCAIGLKVMLRQQKGVRVSDASYPDATVTIQYDPGVVHESSLRSYITDLGFTVEEQKG